MFRSKPKQNSGLAGPTAHRAAPPKRRLPGYADEVTVRDPFERAAPPRRRLPDYADAPGSIGGRDIGFTIASSRTARELDPNLDSSGLDIPETIQARTSKHCPVYTCNWRTKEGANICRLSITIKAN